jgi:hypothetical protein
MSATIVYGVLGCGKSRVGKSTDGHRNVFFIPFFGMKQIRAADGAEPETVLRAAISISDKLRCRAGNIVRNGKSGKCCEYAPGSALTSEAMTYTDAEWLAHYFNA